jgi:hypothetical protein
MDEGGWIVLDELGVTCRMGHSVVNVVRRMPISSWTIVYGPMLCKECQQLDYCVWPS